METRQLGRSDLHLTPVGLGTWAMGGGHWVYSWGDQDDAASIRTIHRAVDLGVNWIDTAPVYGLGHSEEVVGEALKGLATRPIIATKCGLTWDSGGRVIPNLRKDSILREADASLRRLGVDAIDLYQIHWPDPRDQIEEGWDAVKRLIDAGKVRFGGVSNFSVRQMERVQAIHPIASLQPPYSLLERRIEDTLPFCAENGVGVIAYSPMQKGMLTGKMSAERVERLPEDDHRKHDPMFREPELSVNLRFTDRLRPIAEEAGRTVAQLVVAWVLRRPEITGAIVGARKPEQFKETVQAVKWKLNETQLGRIQRLLDERREELRDEAS